MSSSMVKMWLVDWPLLEPLKRPRYCTGAAEKFLLGEAMGAQVVVDGADTEHEGGREGLHRAVG